MNNYWDMSTFSIPIWNTSSINSWCMPDISMFQFSTPAFPLSEFSMFNAPAFQFSMPTMPMFQFSNNYFNFDSFTTNDNTSRSAKITSSTLDDEMLRILKEYLIFAEGGGCTIVKGDKGGWTNKGVTDSTYKEWRKRNNLPSQHVRNMTDSEYSDIIKYYWKSSGAEKETNPKMAFYRFALRWGGCSRFNQIIEQSGGNPEKFEELRREYYISISEPGTTNSQFRKGWLNRVDRDKAFANRNFA